MDRLVEYQFELEHQHNDGNWSPLSEDPGHHDAAANDPERGWLQRVFRCTSCGEVVRLTTRQGPRPPDAE